MEIWKDITGYEKYYQVSDLGRVRSLDRMINAPQGKRMSSGIMLAPVINIRSGYYYTALHKEGRLKMAKTHRLVAIEFISNPENKPYINHKDGNKSNNNISNLEWVTFSENMKHAFKIGLIKPHGVKGEKNPAHKVTEKQVREIKRLLAQNKKGRSIAQIYKVSESIISAIKRGKTWAMV